MNSRSVHFLPMPGWMGLLVRFLFLHGKQFAKPGWKSEDFPGRFSTAPSGKRNQISWIINYTFRCFGSGKVDIDCSCQRFSPCDLLSVKNFSATRPNQLQFVALNHIFNRLIGLLRNICISRKGLRYLHVSRRRRRNMAICFFQSRGERKTGTTRRFEED